jgi:peptidoglycan/LPS O-acetylase OafA/YrhL
MAVVLQHFSATAQEHCLVTIPSLVPHGYVAVDFFFVLSGFIMAYTYLASFERSGMAAYRPFLAKRFARIVPLNLAVLLVIGLLGAASVALAGVNIFFQSKNLAYDFAANALMLQGVGIGTNLNGPSWSISTEFAAYLLFPLFVALVFGRRVVLWLTVAVAVLAVTALAAQQPRLAITGEGPPASLIRCFAEFALGLAAYRLSRHPVSRVLCTDAATLGFSVVAAGSLLLRCDLPAVLAFPFLVVAYAGNAGLPARLVSAAPLHFLGVVSFSLYLLHNLFRPMELAWLRAVAPDPVGPVAALSFAAAGSLSVIPFAWLAYVSVERPGRTLVRNLLPGRQLASVRSP